jgi:esterase/lipase
MAGGLVSADTAAQAQVQQLSAYVNGDLPAALQKLTTLANNLNANHAFQGNYANDYRNQAYPAIQKSTKQMHQDLQQMSQSLAKIVAGILTAGGN